MAVIKRAYFLPPQNRTADSVGFPPKSGRIPTPTPFLSWRWRQRFLHNILCRHEEVELWLHAFLNFTLSFMQFCTMRKSPLVLTRRVTESVWTLWRKILPLPGIKPRTPSLQPVAIPTELCICNMYVVKKRFFIFFPPKPPTDHLVDRADHRFRNTRKLALFLSSGDWLSYADIFAFLVFRLVAIVYIERATFWIQE